MASFDRELAKEPRGHLYGREIAANAWYAKGACCLYAGDRDAARAAFSEALARVARHPMARAGLAIANGEPPSAGCDAGAPEPVDHAVARAAPMVHEGHIADAVPTVSAALAAAPPGNGGWLLPIEPLLGVRHGLDAWAPALAVLHLRAR